MSVGAARTSFQASIAALRQTTKWIITAAAALASVIIVGLRFPDVGRLSPSSVAYWLALGGTLLALLGVGAVVWRASLVLLIRYRTLREVLLALESAERESPRG